MADKNIESKVQELIEKEITDLGYELYDVEYLKEGRDFYLRIYINSKEGIGIEDCEKVNNVIDPILDEKDFIKEQYFLEVSSIGLERNLRKEKHFKDAIGENIELKLYKKINNTKTIQGKLESFESGLLKIESQGEILYIDIKDIASAKVIFDW